jgi:hypothetical protein
MWLLGFELRTSGRAVSALNHQAISIPRVHIIIRIKLLTKAKKKKIERGSLLELLWNFHRSCHLWLLSAGVKSMCHQAGQESNFLFVFVF